LRRLLHYLLAIFFQRLQVVKPEKATALFTAHFFQGLQVVKLEKATALFTGHFFPYCPFFPGIAGSKA